jgi:heme-degrading monooxygenase HmoA
MSHMLIKHHVQDYAKWRAIFDDKAGLRVENGEQYAHVFRNADDPDNIVIMFRWDSLENARRWTQDPRLKAAMQEAGVMGPPEILFLADA